MTDYDAYRAGKMESGARFQDHVVRLVHERLNITLSQYVSGAFQRHVGETLQGWEIKHDEQFAATGNLWIEVGEKAAPRAGEYFPSGILRADNSWIYAIGDYRTLFVFAKKTLVLIHESGKYRDQENKLRTSLGFLLPEAIARKWAANVLEPETPRFQEAAAPSAVVKAAPVAPAQGRLFLMTGEETEEFCKHAVKADEIRWAPFSARVQPKKPEVA